MAEIDDLGRRPTRHDREFFSYERDLDGKIARRTIPANSMLNHFDLLNLVKSLYENLTYDQITETKDNGSFYFEILNDGAVVKTFQATIENEEWTIQEAPNREFLGTLVTDEFLVQEDGSKILLES